MKYYSHVFFCFSLQEKAYTTFEDFRESSTAGLLYAIEQRNVRTNVFIYWIAMYLKFI